MKNVNQNERFWILLHTSVFFFFLQIENVLRSFYFMEFYGIVEFYSYYILR